MRPRVIALLMIVCSVALVSAQKTRFGQPPAKAKAGVAYPLQVHVSGIRLRHDCTASKTETPISCAVVIYADATLDGQKLELMGYQIWLPERPIALVPADYKARLFKAPHAQGQNPIGDEYELVMPDETVWRCTVTGISE